MEEKVKKVLDYINGSILGVFFDVDGKVIRFSYNPESKGYTMSSDKKDQDLTLNELLVILNTPELKDVVEAKALEIDSEKDKEKQLEAQYLAEIDALEIDDQEKDRLRLLVKQMLLPTSKVGMGNRVHVFDPELEARRTDYFDHKKEYDEKREKILREISGLEKQAEDCPIEELDRIKSEIEKKWDELTTIPSAPVILSQHLRLNDDGGIQLVTTLDGNVNIRDYKQLSIKQTSDFIKNKDVKIDEELIEQFDGKSRE